MTATIRPILRYPGGKTRLAPWIVSHLPPHRVYVEPFAGSCAVFLTKPPAKVEILNDLDGRVVNLFCVLRDRPDELARVVALTPYSRAEYVASDDPTDDALEAARRFLVRVWMAHGGKLGSKSGWRQGWTGGSDELRGSSALAWKGVPGRIVAIADRLRDAMIDCRPALDVIANWSQPGDLIYADPPYVRSTLQLGANGTKNRTGERPRYYAHEMSDAEHAELLDVLDHHPGPVALSGYRCPLYDERLTHWLRVDHEARAYRNALRMESLWLNPVAVGRRRDLFSLSGVAV